MVLSKCKECGCYNLSNVCRKCGKECGDVVYKFKQLRDAPKDSAKHFERQREKKRV